MVLSRLVNELKGYLSRELTQEEIDSLEASAAEAFERGAFLKGKDKNGVADVENGFDNDDTYVAPMGYPDPEADNPTQLPTPSLLFDDKPTLESSSNNGWTTISRRKNADGTETLLRFLPTAARYAVGEDDNASQPSWFSRAGDAVARAGSRVAEFFGGLLGGGAILCLPYCKTHC